MSNSVGSISSFGSSPLNNNEEEVVIKERGYECVSPTVIALEQLGIIPLTHQRTLETSRVTVEKTIDSKVLSKYFKAYGNGICELNLYYSHHKNLTEALSLCPNLGTLTLHGYYIDKTTVELILLPKTKVFHLDLKDCIADIEAKHALEKVEFESFFPPFYTFNLLSPPSTHEKEPSYGQDSVADLEEASSTFDLAASRTFGTNSMMLGMSFMNPQLNAQGLRSEDRIIQDDIGVRSIQDRLKKRLTSIQAQVLSEKPLGFQYKSAPEAWVEYDSIESDDSTYSASICSSHGEVRGMDNQYISSSFTLRIQEQEYPAQLFGLFEEFLGNEACLYAKHHFEEVLIEQLKAQNPDMLTEDRIWNALKLTFVNLHEQINKEFDQGGTSALITLILGGNLWTASVGPSRSVLSLALPSHQMYQLSEDASLENRRFLNSITKRGGFVLDLDKRLNSLLPFARLLGCGEVGNGLCPRPPITKMPLSSIPKGSTCIMGSQGVFIKASSSEITKTVFDHQENPLSTLTKNLVYSAHNHKSPKSVTVIAIRLSDEDSPVSSDSEVLVENEP